MAQPKLNPNSVLAHIASGVQYDRQDAFIAVMGVTGAGKSTFISRLVGDGVKVGHDLVSCTSEIEIFTFKYNGRTVHLIDTPGFDDTYRTDSDVLKELVFWLNSAYQQKRLLSGIVYLHSINRNRMTGSAYKNLRMFQKLCGDASLASVVLATTMWKNVDEVDGERRQEELKSRPEFWGDLVGRGSRVFRHDDTRVSALNIITYILDQRLTTVLQIQRQMVDEGKSLDETSAGQELEKELLKQKELFERRLREAQEEMQDAIVEGNKRAAEEAAEQQERFQRKLKEALKGSDELKVSMEKLLQQKDAEYKKALQDMEAARQKSLDDSKQTTQQLEELRQRMKARDEEVEEQRRKHAKDIDEMSIRFSKQNMESQVSFQEWMAEQRRLTVPTTNQDQTAAYTPENKSTFEDAFAQGAGVTIGEAAGAAAAGTSLIAVGMAASMCSIM